MVVNTKWAENTAPIDEIQENIAPDETITPDEAIEKEAVLDETPVPFISDDQKSLMGLQKEPTPIDNTKVPFISEEQKDLVEGNVLKTPEPVIAWPQEPTPKEEVADIKTTTESVQDIKGKELDNKQKEITQKEAERQAKNQDILAKATAFDEAAKAWNFDLMTKMATENPDLKAAFTTSLRNVFGNKSNILFVGKFQGASNEKMKSWVESWEIVIGSKQYNMLPEEQRRRFEQFNKLNTAKRSNFSNDNENVISTEDIGAKIPELTTVDFRKEMNELLNNPELKKSRKELEEKQNEISEIDDALERLEDDLEKEFSRMPRSFILAEKAKRAKNLIRSKNSLINQYNAKLWTYKDMKNDINMELDVLKFEDAQNKAVYQTELERYKTARSEMREDEKIKFLEDNRKLAAQTQFDRQKELAEFNANLRKESMAWGQYIDNWEGDLLYVKDGKQLSVLTWLGKPVSTSEDENYTWQTKVNDDGSYTVFGLPKKGQNVVQKSFTANGDAATSYIKSTGTGSITSYGWNHDKFQGLDIDWNVGDPITTPIGWKVIEVSKHPWYGNTMVVQLSDGNKIRYSHLDVGYFKKWDIVGKWAVIWTMWNTGNVLKLDWTKPSAQELAQGFGSHLDIVTTDPDGNVRSAKETESYLNNAGIPKENPNMLTKDEKVFFNQQQSKFLANPQVKAFESALASVWDLSLSLKAITWPWDVAAIFNFMKTLDPTSVVREGEFALAANTAGISAKPWILLEKIKNWTQLDQKTRDEFWRLAFEYVKSKWKLYDNAYDDMQRILENNGIGGSNLPTRATDLIEGFDSNKVDVISWGKTYTTSSGYSYDTTWANQERNNFFNN